jgi:hypothetical protein
LNQKGCGREQSWRGTIPAFAWKDWRKKMRCFSQNNWCSPVKIYTEHPHKYKSEALLPCVWIRALRFLPFGHNTQCMFKFSLALFFPIFVYVIWKWRYILVSFCAHKQSKLLECSVFAIRYVFILDMTYFQSSIRTSTYIILKIILFALNEEIWHF